MRNLFPIALFLATLPGCASTTKGVFNCENADYIRDAAAAVVTAIEAACPVALAPAPIPSAE